MNNQIRQDTETIPERGFNWKKFLKLIKKRFGGKNPYNGTKMFLIGIVLKLLKKYDQQVRSNFQKSVQKLIDEIGQRWSSPQKNVRFIDLFNLLCSPILHRFWIQHFSFGDFFTEIHQAKRIVKEKKLFYILNTTTLWHFIETTELPAILESKKLSFMTYTQLRQKKYEFCYELLLYLQNYFQTNNQNANLNELDKKVQQCKVELRNYLQTNSYIQSSISQTEPRNLSPIEPMIIEDKSQTQTNELDWINLQDTRVFNTNRKEEPGLQLKDFCCNDMNEQNSDQMENYDFFDEILMECDENSKYEHRFLLQVRNEELNHVLFQGFSTIEGQQANRVRQY